MAKIDFSDLSGSAALDIKDNSLAAQHGLSQLKAEAKDVVTALDRPLQQQPYFIEAKLGAGFSVASASASGAAVGARVVATSRLCASRCADSPLFGKADYDPVAIAGDDCWLTFELDTSISQGASLPLPDGFGVCISAGTAPKFGTHVRFPGQVAKTLTLRDALTAVLSNFRVLDSVDAVLTVPVDTIYVADIEGSVQFGASWQLPLLINQYCLASQPLPFGQCLTLSPAACVGLQGSVKLESEFSVRVWRVDANTLHFGLYRKKDESLTVQFDASAGLAGNLAGTDMIKTIMGAVAPGADTKVLPPDEAKEIECTLKESVNHSLSIGLNAQYSATDEHETMLVYSMDVTNVSQAQRDAIKLALIGDWRGFDNPAVATKLRDIIRDTVEHKSSLRMNFLGIYNSKTVDDLIRDMKVLKNDENGEVTITDKATATHILTDSSPLAKPADRLRHAAYEGFVATLTYQALMKGVGTNLSGSASQTFFEYQEQMNRDDVSRFLRTGEVLGLMAPGERANLRPANDKVHHARFSASREYGADAVLGFFFADPQQLVPHRPEDLLAIAKQSLAALIEPTDEIEQQRIVRLTDPAAWAEMSNNPAQIDIHFQPDYMDITGWVDAMGKTARSLADVISYARGVNGDPTLDKTFQQKRQALEKSMANVTKSTRALFDPAFAIGVMSKLAGSGGKPPVFEADWDGKTVFSSQPVVLTQAAGANPL